MSIRIAGELVREAKREERARIYRIVLKAIRAESSGKCCDNCRCCTVATIVAALRPRKRKAA